jgi:hypothetical protein
MTRTARIAAQFAITAVLATALSFAVPVFVDRHEFTTAVSNYVKNPSPNNEAILRVAKAKNQRVALVTHLVAAGVLFILMNAGWYLVRRKSATPA